MAFLMYLGSCIIICVLYNICSIYTYVPHVDGMIIYVYLCMLLVTHCMHFYWVILHTKVFDVNLNVYGYSLCMDLVQEMHSVYNTAHGITLKASETEVADVAH